MGLSASAQTAPSLAVSPPGEERQDAGRLETLARTLSDGVSCTGGNPRDVLDERGRKSGATPADIGAALAVISSSSDICAPVRTAASAMSADLVARQAATLQVAQPADPADPGAGAAAAAQARLANEALEAEARAASTRFVVGPPPRNLTRGRIAGL
jgi:hypothetical protein